MTKRPSCLLAVNPYVLVVNSSVPAKNVPELIALLRANPGKYSFSSSGSGASSHLASVLFNSMANVSAVHVPYKGSSPSVADLVSGQVAYTMETVPGVISFVKSGRLRALGVSSAKRSTAMPELPTIADDLPGYEMSGWIGFMAPAGTPREISGRLSREVRKILEIPEIRERFEGRLFTLHELEQRGVRIAGANVWYLSSGQDWRLKLEPVV